MKNYKRKGDTLEYLNETGSKILSGDVVVLPGIGIGVGVSDIEDQEEGTLLIEDVVSLEKANVAIPDSARVYWDDTNKNVTTTAAGNTLIGMSAKNHLAGDLECDVKLIPMADTDPGDLNQAANVVELGATTDLTAVPGAFADLAAVQSYLATVTPEIESRLDAVEAKIDAIISGQVAAGLMAAP